MGKTVKAIEPLEVIRMQHLLQSAINIAESIAEMAKPGAGNESAIRNASYQLEATLAAVIEKSNKLATDYLTLTDNL